jgi:hypothetical protein
MADESASTRVYHVSPWRRRLVWLVTGPMILFLLVAALTDSRVGGGRAMLLAAGVLLVISLLAGLVVRRARLEFSPQGVRLHQTGYTLETSWSNVAGLRLQRGSEGLITAEGMQGNGPERLASMRGIGMNGAPLYDEEQQELLAQHRFIPIEAFAWHLRHGRMRADLARFAPHLQAALDAPEAPDPNALRGRALWKVIGLTACLLAPAIALALAPEQWQSRILGIFLLGLAPLLALRAAISARNSIRTRAWWLAIFFAALALVLGLWSIGLWLEYFKGPAT